MEISLSCLVVSRRVLVWFVLFLVAMATSVKAQNRLPVPLPGVLHGEAAIAALGAQLPAVAQAHGLQAQNLATLFRTQAGLKVDPNGALLFVCDAPSVWPAQTQSVNTVPSPEVGEIVTSSSGDPLFLHSFPGASRVIYLDFNGHTTSGTSWNSQFSGGAAIVSQPFDIDGSPNTFSAQEQALIRGVWQRVAEEFAPFAIDVTTEDPGVEALRRTNSNDTIFGVRVVISPTNWYSGSAGGVAYIGSFNWNTDTPCFAFTQQLANGEKYIADSAAHEAGHTLGLYHDGASGPSSTEYYGGQGNWAPIMGLPYYQTVTHFSRGEYSNANNTQDDLAIISGFAPYASDDHGNTLNSASMLGGPVVSNGGTIEQRTDVDLFRFDASAGYLTLNVRGPSPDPNLDINAELLDANGQVLQTSSPATLDASIAASVGAGTYYLRVSGVGSGDPATTGYSNYGSVGNYVITGTLPTASWNPPSITVPGAITAEATGPAGAVVYFVTSATDRFGTAIGTNNYPSSGSTFGLGVSTVTVTATDNTGTTASTTFTVTVRDSTPPAISVPGNLAVQATDGSGAIVNFSTSAYDVVSGSHPTTNLPGSGSYFYLGTTVVTVNAWDTVGNIAASSFSITVTPSSSLAAPSGVIAASRDSGVDLTWSGVSQATSYRVKRSTVSGGPYTLIATNLTGPFYTDYGLNNGTTYYYVVSAANSGAESANSGQVSASPHTTTTSGAEAYVTGTELYGTLRNDYTGWVGMQFVVGSNPLTVSELGRMKAPGNNGTHRVKLVDANTGADVPGGAADVALSGGTSGQFHYGALPAPVTLASGTAYWILSQEAAGSDSWYDVWNTRVSTTTVATQNAAAWGTGPGDWHSVGVGNQSFVPLNFKYGKGGTTSTSNSSSYVTGTELYGTLRNDYTGWVGMQFVVGSNPLTVSELGRMKAPGNSGTHRVKLVNANTGADVPGGAADVALSGGASGEFHYGALPAPITLASGTTYWILSQETAGTDSWYDVWNTRVSTTTVATQNAAAWGTGPGDWHSVGVGNQSFVPLNFKYGSGGTTSTSNSSSYVTGTELYGTLRNDYSGWIGMQFVVGSNPLTVSELGRMKAPGNSGTHRVKLVEANTGADVPGGAADVALSGGASGEFRYGALSAPITLASGTTYWILSQETAGTDSWYDVWNTRVSTTNVATQNAAAWGTGPGDWHAVGVGNQSFVPLDFKYR